MPTPESVRRRLELLASGLSTKMVAERLGELHHTVKAYRWDMIKKHGSLNGALKALKPVPVPSHVVIRLTPRQREAAVLFGEGMDIDQVAAKMGIGYSQVTNLRGALASKCGSLENAICRVMEDMDELPDEDEPYGPVQRCKCGLVMPCHHEQMSLIGSVSGSLEDEGEGRYW